MSEEKDLIEFDDTEAISFIMNKSCFLFCFQWIPIRSFRWGEIRLNHFFQSLTQIV